ncbi:tetratricopeptide repeat protein [uncultured Desulfobacter sp.]|uniref:tetratricopeptide repeat protein n=1 Tax=uncultured Desulfobacter sp. TaxID=240139 RepID=UPI002AAB2814|nr:tetratricopeptide repeat protein [uncultured Desulfobacter sp.]
MPTYLHLSRIFKAQGNIEEAKNFLNQALSIKRDYAPAANNLAYIMAEIGSSLYEALRLSKVASDKDPNNSEYLDTLGWIYYLQGNNDLAIVTIEESVKLNPKSAIGQYHLGWACYESKQYEKARTHMETALELDPNFKGADKARNILGR